LREPLSELARRLAYDLFETPREIELVAEPQGLGDFLVRQLALETPPE
jgi:hypothetical protein